MKNPSDAQPYVGLADCYNLLREFGAMSPSEAYPRALSAAQRAVELDDSSAEAHNSLAFVTFWWLWHGKTAEREFQRAIELNPDLARAHHWYATYLLALHRHPEALNQIEQAQRLDPSSTAVLADKGDPLWKAGRREEGLTLLKQLETTEPSLSSTHSYLGEIFGAQQEYPSALQEWRQAAELRHDEPGLTIAGAREKGYAAGGLRGMQEREMEVRKILFNQGFGTAYDLALICATLGERKRRSITSKWPSTVAKPTCLPKIRRFPLCVTNLPFSSCQLASKKASASKLSSQGHHTALCEEGDRAALWRFTTHRGPEPSRAPPTTRTGSNPILHTARGKRYHQ